MAEHGPRLGWRSSYKHSYISGRLAGLLRRASPGTLPGCGTVGALPPNPFFGKSLPPAVGVLPPGALFGAPLPPAARHVYGGPDPLAHYPSLDCEADLEIRL